MKMISLCTNKYTFYSITRFFAIFRIDFSEICFYADVCMAKKQSVTTIIPTPPLWKRTLLVLLGALLFALNLNTFVHTANLFPGGFAGVTLLIQRTAERFFGIQIPYTVLYWALNAFPVYISFKYIGKKFTIFSLVMIAVSSVLTDVLPSFHATDDVLLCSVFGGIINGIAVTLCLRAGATSGGTDFIAIYFAEKKGKDMWNMIFGINCTVLGVAGLLFGWESALYSIIFQFASTQVLNVLYQRYQKATILIITEHPDELYAIVNNEASHDATKLDAVGCYRNSKKYLLYTVVSSDQVKSLCASLRRADPLAFINVLQTKEILGRFFTRRAD